MLDVRCPEHMKEVREFAKKEGIEDNLQKRLDYLANYGESETRCIVTLDIYGGHSFGLVMQRKTEDDTWDNWWVGGLIYHEHDQTWGVHT